MRICTTDIEDWRPGTESKTSKNADPYIVQRYIERPLLVDGLKFDLRIFVLVTSFAPPRAWIYREGIARFCGTPYSTENIQDRFVHLTNRCVQKTASNCKHKCGCLWLLDKLRQYLASVYGQGTTDGVFKRINDVCLNTLQARDLKNENRSL